jgi:ribosomal protein S18 acetylase RimI-like enzyme
LNAICNEARLQEFSAVRLDVIATNTRAIALYRRLGFEVVGRQDIGILRLVFGFSTALTMVRQL